MSNIVIISFRFDQDLHSTEFVFALGTLSTSPTMCATLARVNDVGIGRCTLWALHFYFPSYLIVTNPLRQSIAPNSFLTGSSSFLVLAIDDLRCFLNSISNINISKSHAGYSSVILLSYLFL